MLHAKKGMLIMCFPPVQRMCGYNGANPRLVAAMLLKSFFWLHGFVFTVGGVSCQAENRLLAVALPRQNISAG